MTDAGRLPHILTKPGIHLVIMYRVCVCVCVCRVCTDLGTLKLILKLFLIDIEHSCFLN